MMNDFGNVMLPLLAGMALGGMFFGGLWWTIHTGLTSRHPAIWFLISQWLRVGLTLVGFYFVAGDQWQRLLLCLAGFVIARMIVMRITGGNLAPIRGIAKPGADPGAKPGEAPRVDAEAQEAGHASQS